MLHVDVFVGSLGVIGHGLGCSFGVGSLGVIGLVGVVPRTLGGVLAVLGDDVLLFLHRRGRGREQRLLEDDPVVAQHVVGVELAGTMTCTSGRLRNLSAAECRSGRPRRAPALDAEGDEGCLASLVFGASKPQLSTTTTLPSLARSDSAERRASLIIFFGVRWAYERGFGPRAMPPPLYCGELVEPWRALPVPFWRYGLAPPPRTSLRVFVLCVPARRAASWAVTTWCITGTLGWMPNIASSSSTLPASAPAGGLEGDLGHLAQRSLTALFTALRTTTTPPLGPGTEPLTSSRLRSGSDSTTSRLRVVTCSWPMWPDIRMPLNTRPGKAHEPIAPGRPVVLVVAVARALTLEVVALHRAGEALAPADRRDVDLGAGGDGVDEDLLADLVAVDRLEAQLDEPLAGIDRRLGEVTGLGLGELLGVAVAVGDLQRAVAVALGGLHLDDAHRLDAQHRHRDDLVVDPLLAHADLLADDRCGCHCGCSLLLLIERPSPAAIHTGAEPAGLGVQMLRRSRPAEHSIELSPCGPWQQPPGAHGHRLRGVPCHVRGHGPRHKEEMLAAPRGARNQQVQASSAAPLASVLLRSPGARRSRRLAFGSVTSNVALAVADDDDGDLVAGLVVADRRDHAGAAVGGGVVDGDDDVAGLDAGLFGR